MHLQAISSSDVLVPDKYHMLSHKDPSLQCLRVFVSSGECPGEGGSVEKERKKEV